MDLVPRWLKLSYQYPESSHTYPMPSQQVNMPSAWSLHFLNLCCALNALTSDNNIKRGYVITCHNVGRETLELRFRARMVMVMVINSIAPECTCPDLVGHQLQVTSIQHISSLHLHNVQHSTCDIHLQLDFGYVHRVPSPWDHRWALPYQQIREIMVMG